MNDDDTFYSIGDIAHLLGKSKQYISHEAKLGSWPYTTRPGRGGQQRLYRLGDLPGPTRARIQKAEIEAIWAERAAEQARIQAAQAAEALVAEERAANQGRLEHLAQMDKKVKALPADSPLRLRAEARAWMLAQVEDYKKDDWISWQAAQCHVALQLTADFKTLPEFVKPYFPTYGGTPSLSEGTLQRWRDNRNRDGLWGLTYASAGRARTILEKNPDLYRVVIGALIQQPQIKAPRIMDYLESQPAYRGRISPRSLQRSLKEWKAENPQLWTYMTHPDRWKNIYMSAAGSALENVTRINQLWEMDSTPGDWLLSDGRHSVIGAIDLFSRRLKWRVSKTSTGAAISQLLRRCLLEWGVPETIRTDNGADYLSQQVGGFLRALQINHQICIPFASEEKGTIERAMRTMSHGLLELLPGYIGHSVAERKTIEARKSFAERVMTHGEVVQVSMSAADLQTALDEWTDQVYARSAHAGLDGQTPWQVANAWSGRIIRITDIHALDELLIPVAGTRIIGKKGIRLEDRYYIDPAGVLHQHVGEEVTLRQDEDDLGRLTVYLNGAFLCHAEDPDVTGISRREAAAAIKAHQKKYIAAQARALREATKEMRGVNLVQTVIDYRKSQAENVIELPKPSEPYSTPELEQAGIAARDRATRPVIVPATQAPAESAEARAARKWAEADMARSSRLSDLQGEPALYEAWKVLRARQEKGENLTEEESAFFARVGGLYYTQIMWEEEQAYYGVGA